MVWWWLGIGLGCFVFGWLYVYGLLLVIDLVILLVVFLISRLFAWIWRFAGCVDLYVCFVVGLVCALVSGLEFVLSRLLVLRDCFRVLLI